MFFSTAVWFGDLSPADDEGDHLRETITTL
jgi:hypothetical protein